MPQSLAMSLSLYSARYHIPTTTTKKKNRTVFGESYVEIRYMLETNLLTRFLETQEFMDQEMTAPAQSAGRRRQGRPSSIHDGDEADMELGMGDDGGVGGVGGGVDPEQPTPRRSRLEYPEMGTL